MGSLQSSRMVAAIAMILVIQTPWLATCDGNFLGPILGPIVKPIIETLCPNVINCGQGNCRTDNKSMAGYVCDCKPGWKQVRLPNDDGLLAFMPCVLPNCSIDFTCSGSPPTPRNPQDYPSPIDPCHYVDCGGGVCKNTAPFVYKCECQEGYSSLLNATIFPCSRDCALGLGCSNLGLGIQVNNTSNTATPNNGGAMSRGDFIMLIVLVISITLFPLIR